MENEPKKPGDALQADKKSSDAAAMSARILALQGDSDEYSYSDPLPKPSAPIVSPKAKRRGSLKLVLAVIGIFLLGGLVSTRVEKWLIGQGGGMGIRLEKWFGSRSVAVINGESISAEEFAHASEIPSGRTAMQRLIDDKLVIQYAKKMGVYPDSKDVDTKFNEESRSPSFFQNLKRVNENQEDYRYNLLVTMCKQAIVSNGIKVNPSEIQAYYQKNIDRNNKTARFFHPETVQAAVIISPDKEALENAQKDIAGGMSFAAAVMKYSADRTKATNGVLPPLSKGNRGLGKYPGLENVLFNLQVGNTSDIIQIGKFYWIIKCIAHNPEVVDPFEKVQDLCTTGLLFERGIKTNGQEITKKEQDFVKASNITISLEQYAELSPKR